MQVLVPSGIHNPNNHSATTIRDALVGKFGGRKLTFRYELLDLTNTKVMDLEKTVISGRIEQNFLADIKRKATFSIRDTGVVNYLSDRIKPWVRFHLPPFGTNDWAEWPQGVFGLTTPTRQADEVDRVIREVEGYDLLQNFMDDVMDPRYSVAAGANVITTVSTLLGSIPKKVTAASTTLTSAKEWEPGTAKLHIINELLGIAGYESLFADEDGFAVVQPYQSPEDRLEEWTYADDHEGVIVPHVDQTLDLFSVANKWVLVVSEPDRPLLVSTYTNSNPASPTSTVRRGRTITDFRLEETEAATQAILDAKVRRLALEASQVYEHLEFQTALMPIHSNRDVYRITYGPLAIDAKYHEQSWSMTLEAGQPMGHDARRVVSI